MNPLFYLAGLGGTTSAYNNPWGINNSNCAMPFIPFFNFGMPIQEFGFGNMYSTMGWNPTPAKESVLINFDEKVANANSQADCCTLKTDLVELFSKYDLSDPVTSKQYHSSMNQVRDKEFQFFTKTGNISEQALETYQKVSDKKATPENNKQVLKEIKSQLAAGVSPDTADALNMALFRMDYSALDEESQGVWNEVQNKALKGMGEDRVSPQVWAEVKDL